MVHDGKPFFAYYFGIGVVLTILGISARVIYERSNGSSEPALKMVMISKYTLLLMAVYLAASVPFMFGMA